jgi:tripartite-type tricarboxylate transporter receptor subunit TctC
MSDITGRRRSSKSRSPLELRAAKGPAPTRIMSEYMSTVDEHAQDRVAGFEAFSWFGLLAPAGMPPDIVSKVTAVIETAQSRPGVQESFEATGAQTGAILGADFRQFMRQESEKWRGVIKTSGVSLIE